MIEMTQPARERLDEYLRRVRSYLRFSRTVDPQEVERDIREHIETALADCAAPVKPDELDAVVGQLGSPNQWVPEEELPWWRRMVLRLHSGPEDWRLAYVTIGLFIGSFVLVGIWPVVIAASFLCARATLSLSDELGEPLGPKRWLVYPPLIVVYLLLVAVFSGGIFPIAPLIGLADGLEHDNWVQIHFPSSEYWQVAWMFITMAFGFWWIILGAAARRWPNVSVAVFRPFTSDGLVRRCGLIMMVVGLACLVGGLIFLMMPD